MHTYTPSEWSSKDIIPKIYKSSVLYKPAKTIVPKDGNFQLFLECILYSQVSVSHFGCQKPGYSGAMKRYEVLMIHVIDGIYGIVHKYNAMLKYTLVQKDRDSEIRLYIQ